MLNSMGNLKATSDDEDDSDSAGGAAESVHNLKVPAQSRRPSSDPSASGTREDASHGAAGGGGPGQDPGRKRRPGEKSADYYANVGDAVRTLREDLPMMFMREPNFNIYRRDHGLRCAVRPAHVG